LHPVALICETSCIATVYGHAKVARFIRKAGIRHEPGALARRRRPARAELSSQFAVRDPSNFARGQQQIIVNGREATCSPF